MTGQGDEGLAVRTLRAGAADYIVKSQLTSESLLRAILNAIQRRQASALLRAERNRFLNEQRDRIEAQEREICALHESRVAARPSAGVLSPGANARGGRGGPHRRDRAFERADARPGAHRRAPVQSPDHVERVFWRGRGTDRAPWCSNRAGHSRPTNSSSRPRPARPPSRASFS